MLYATLVVVCGAALCVRAATPQLVTAAAGDGLTSKQPLAQGRVNAPGTRSAQRTTKVPRTPDGRPDLEGTWDFSTATPLERPKQFATKPVLTDEEADAYVKSLPKDGCRIINCDGNAQGRLESAYDEAWWAWGQKLAENRTSLIVDPPDGRIPPLTDAARQRTTTAFARGAAGVEGPEGLRVVDRCLAGFNTGPPMTPSAYNNYMQLVQTRDYVVILNEMIHDARVVHLGSKGSVNHHLKRWMGHSRGWWEGEVFVVETTHFRPDSNSLSANPQAFRLVERFQRTDGNTLVYEYTMNDPNTWTRPWTVRLPMTKTDAQVFEYACHEGNYSLPNMLSAIRAQQNGSVSNASDPR